MTTKDYDNAAIAQTYDEAQHRPSYKEMLDDFAERHSEFERPYAEDEYNRVEGFYPPDDFKGYTWQPGQIPDDYVRQWTDNRTGNKPQRHPAIQEDSICILPCDGTTITDCGTEKEYVCDLKPIGGITLGLINYKAVNEKPGDGLDIFKIDVSGRTSATIEDMCGGSGPPTAAIGDDEIVITFSDDPGVGTLRIEAHMTSIGCDTVGIGDKNTCIADIRIECCDADTTALSFDDASTADTINRSSSITLYINGSGKTFKWSVSGTGVSLLHQETSGTTNKLTADGTACGAAQVTVEDCSGATVSFEIRVVEASDWCLIDECAPGALD
jgi:hypothetical protein